MTHVARTSIDYWQASVTLQNATVATKHDLLTFQDGSLYLLSVPMFADDHSF